MTHPSTGRTGRAELDQALALVEEALRERRPWNRYHARAVLLPLGALLGSEDEGDRRHAREAIARLARATGPTRDAWGAVLDEELEMAVTELVKSLDPRFLARPDYDLRYTLESRALLRDRLRAMEALGRDVDPSLLRHVERSERALEVELRRRGASDASTRSGGRAAGDTA